MTLPDFSGVDPLRLAEARRRIAILEEYLNLERPAVADAASHAARIGISRSQFYNLTKAWRLHRDPNQLGLNKGYVASRDYGIDQRASAILAGKLEDTDRLEQLIEAVRTQCQSEGITPPSAQTMRNRFREQQAVRPRLEGPRRILVSRMWFHLPIAGSFAQTMPILLTATLIPERFIVGQALSLDEARPPDIRRLIRDVNALRSPGAYKRGLLIDRHDRRCGGDLLSELEIDAERNWKGSVQREASRHFAGRLGALEAVFQRGSARPSEVVTAKVRRMSADDARAAIDEAIALNNRRAGCEQPAFDIRAK